MKLDVVFSPAGLASAEVQGRTVFVIDILRATTSMCAALSHGAKAIIPVASTEEALRLAQTIGSSDVLLAGEKNCLPIPGFPLGQQSPGDDRVHRAGEDAGGHHDQRNQGVARLPGRGRGVSCRRGQPHRRGGEGARSPGAGQGCRDRVRRHGTASSRWTTPTAPAGWSPRRWAAQGPGAGSTTPPWRAWTSCDAIGERWERPLLRSRAGRELARLGFRDDVTDAARLDAYPVLAQFHDRRVTLPQVPV